MKIGYARKSGNKDSLKNQTDALKKFNCEKIFQEKHAYSGKRPEFKRMLSYLHRGDMLVVSKLDRIGRSLKDLINLCESLRRKGIDFVSLQDKIDTSKKPGKSFYYFIISLTEFEMALKGEEMINGPAITLKRGRKGGRPKGLSELAVIKVNQAQKLYENDSRPVADIVKSLGIGKTTFYRYLHYSKADEIKKRETESRMSNEKINKNKIRKELFQKLLESRSFWSYTNLSYEKISDDLLIQKVMEELDIDDIKKLFILYNKNLIRQIWKDEMVIQDPYNRSLNILLAKLFFDIKKPEQYIRRVQRDVQKSISAS